MPTDLCRYCGNTYDIVGGHSCTPMITTSNTGPTPIVLGLGADESPDEIAAVFGAGEKGVTGPPDLAHAIQAAKVALEATYDWDGYDVGEVARIAIDAATAVPVQADDLKLAVHALTAQLDLETKLQITRDRLADLEVYAADAVEALTKIINDEHWARHDLSKQATYKNCLEGNCPLANTVLAADPLARGRAILEEVERLKAQLRREPCEDCYEACCGTRDACRCHLRTLDLAAAQKEDGG